MKKNKIISFLTVLFLMISLFVVRENVQAVGQYSDRLLTGERLNVGERITSPNGAYTLILQGDANLVEFRTSDGVPVWSSLQQAKPVSNGYYAIMQGDGNLVVYDSNNIAIWATMTANQGANVFTISDNGCLNVSNEEGTFWGTPAIPKEILRAGETLAVGQSLTSTNKQYSLVMQADGNLVEYRASDGAAIWNSRTGGRPLSSDYVTVMQYDGNFVVYDASKTAIWQSGTYGKNGAYMKLQDDGSLTLCIGSEIIWATSPNPVDTLKTGQSLSVGEKLTSQGGDYYLVLQGDGNLVEYSTSDGVAIWNSQTGGRAISTEYVAIMQPDGNFVIYDGNKTPIWQSCTAGKNATHLQLQNDGNLCLIAGTTAVWDSKGYTNPPPPPPTPVEVPLGDKVVKYAMKFLGTPYVWTGVTPAGFDCSGFTKYVYRNFGISIPRVAADQYKYGPGVLISKDKLIPGDLVFFKGYTHSSTNPGHVGIYVGNGEFIHAPKSGDVVKISPLSSRSDYVGARRPY